MRRAVVMGVCLAVGVLAVGPPVLPAEAVEPWAGLLDVSVDRPVVDASEPEAVLRVAPSVRVTSPFSMSVYTSAGRRVGYCAASNSACRDGWDLPVSVGNSTAEVFEVFVASEHPSGRFPTKDVSARGSVRVENVGWTGSLAVSADRELLDASTAATVVRVAPSIRVVAPYSMSLYDEAGKRVGYCQASNSSCRDGWSVTVNVANYTSKTYTAYVATSHPAAPPSDGVAASGSVVVANQGWVGSLAVEASRSVVDAWDPKSSIVVTPSIRVVAPYSMSLYDEAGKRVGYCQASNSSCRDGWSV
ncbi:MAG: hypothetical protein LBG60_11990, partial [Bifidobacteriaceae bacterium]|nr:hypothetical protein [Bifidobacteriaceae bacterium]